MGCTDHPGADAWLHGSEWLCWECLEAAPVGPLLNPVLQELRMLFAGRTPTARVVKVQAPDGLVLLMDDGTRWAVTAHRLGVAR